MQSEDTPLEGTAGASGIKSPLIRRALMLGIPFLFVGGYLLILHNYLPYETFLLMGGIMLAYFIPPAGKESMIPLGIALGIPWYTVATSIAILDVAAALFMAWNFDLALKIPVLGDWINRFMEGGSRIISRHRWLEGLYFFGLVAFVMFPLQGSGGIGGSILGRILGMKKIEVVAAVALGAFIGSFAIAIGVEYILRILERSLFIGLMVIVVLMVILGSYIITRYNRDKYRDEPEYPDQ
ncbi:MAG TPA: small multi-drug export protein [Methanoregulaceae archaeon]|nr:small multi-drug export protein [Methanoregulaceae archaeon]